MKIFVIVISSFLLLIQISVADTNIYSPSISISTDWEWLGAPENVERMTIRQETCDQPIRQFFSYCPYVAVDSERIFQEATSCGGDILGWAESSKVKGAKELILNWKTKSETGELFGCSDSTCYTIVRTELAEEPRDGLAICNISKIDRLAGVPQHCVELYISSERGEFIRRIMAPSRIACLVGLPDFDLVIISEPERELPILTFVENALNSPPLDLEVVRSYSTLLGKAEYRASKIFDGYRELLSVRVDMDEPYQINPNYQVKGIIVSTAFYINRQNTSQRKDWVRPTEAQESVYVSVIEDEIKKSLAGNCIVPRWISSKVLLCDLPEDVEISEYIYRR